MPSHGLQDCEHGRGMTKELQSATSGGNVLVVMESRTEMVAQFVVSSTEPRGGSGTLKAAHRPVSAFQATMVLFQSIVFVAAGPMANILAQLSPDRLRIAVMAIGGNPLGYDAGDRLS